MGVSDKDRVEYTHRFVKRVRTLGSHKIEVTVSPKAREMWQAEHLAHVILKGRSLSDKMDDVDSVLKELGQNIDELKPLSEDPSTYETDAIDSPAPHFTSRIHSLFHPPEFREAAIGDREEIFHKDAAKHGRSWAVWLYRWDTFVAMCSWMKKMVSFSAIAGLGGAVLKWLGAGA